MNQNSLLFIQIRLPLSMHHEWKEMIDVVCKTTNGKSMENQRGSILDE